MKFFAAGMNRVFLLFLFLMLGRLTASENRMIENSGGFSPRPMLVFLDDAEENDVTIAGQKMLPFVMGGFCTALFQCAGPIIVSQHVINNMLKNPSTKLFFEKSFDEKKWIIKNPLSCDSRRLVLFLPRVFFEQFVCDKVAEKCFPGVGKETALELLLGLKINCMDSLQAVNLTTKDKKGFCSASSFIDAVLENEIFCSKNEYVGTKFEIPRWSFVLCGHGYYENNSMLGGMRQDQFREFLDFCDKKIFTQLLVYGTCFSGGSNTDKLYWFEKTKMQKTYSFAIVQSSLTDAPCRPIATPFKVGVDSCEEIKMHNQLSNFKGFCDDVMHMECSLRSYSKLLENVFKFNDAGTMAQIKLPQTECFSILTSAASEILNPPDIKKLLRRKALRKLIPKRDSCPSELTRAEAYDLIEGESLHMNLKKPEILSIGTILSATRGTQPLLVPLNVKYILLYAQDIPFSIDFTSFTEKNHLPKIISMISGDAVHRIAGIKFNEKMYEQCRDAKECLIATFGAVKNLCPAKKFIINSVYYGELSLSKISIFKLENNIKEEQWVVAIDDTSDEVVGVGVGDRKEYKECKVWKSNQASLLITQSTDSVISTDSIDGLSKHILERSAATTTEERIKQRDTVIEKTIPMIRIQTFDAIKNLANKAISAVWRVVGGKV